MANNVVRLFDVAPPGGAVDPGDPVTFAASGNLITAKSPPALVKKLQLLLASWGFSPGTPDGVYGVNTGTAVRSLQTKLGIPADGFFGAGTAKAVQADLAKGAASILRANTVLFRPPALPPKGGTTGSPEAPAQAESTLPATQPAQEAFPWLWVIGGAAALFFILSRFGKSDGDEILAPPGSVVADLGDGDEDEDEDEADVEDFVSVEEDEPPPPKKKRKRKPRKKVQIEGADGPRTPDEVLPPEDDAIDVEFTDVP